MGIASGCSDGFGDIVGVQKVQGKARTFFFCGICQCAMCNAKVEEDGTPGWQFDGDGSFFGYCAVDVMVAVGIPVVGVDFSVAVGYDVQCAVGDVGVVKGNPHANAFGGVADFEIRIVLMPVRANALFAGFEKDLVEVEHEG